MTVDKRIIHIDLSRIQDFIEYPNSLVKAGEIAETIMRKYDMKVILSLTFLGFDGYFVVHAGDNKRADEILDEYNILCEKMSVTSATEEIINKHKDLLVISVYDGEDYGVSFTILNNNNRGK